MKAPFARRPAGRSATLAALVLLGLAGALSGQELEPRAYAAAPVGTNFLALAGAYSSGSVLLDPSLPITDVTADIGAVAFAYLRTFGFAGRQASLAATIPYAFGTLSGNVQGDYTTTSRAGLGDARLRLALNLLGGPALTPKEFARRTPRTSLGASLIVVVPTGEYYADRLVNIGARRWAFKPELGLSVPLGKWIVDLAGGMWLFTANDNFYGGQVRTQDPLWSAQAHASYTFRPGLWLAGDATFYSGGRTRLDGVVKDDRQANSRCGLTFAWPFAKGWALKLSASTGVSTRIGGKFTVVGAAVQYYWFDR